MKTKAEILTLDSLIDSIQTNIADEKLKPFKYMFLRNKLRFASVAKERNEIGILLKNTFPKIENETEDEHNIRVSNSKEYLDFLKEEVEIEYYTIKIDALADVEDYSLTAANALLGILIIE